MHFIKNLMGMGPRTDFKALKEQGAVLIDVRTTGEFRGGSVAGAVNIPLQDLPRRWPDVPKDKTIIVFCQSGNRSGSAKSLLERQGYSDVHNGGGWRQLSQKLQ